MNSSKSNRFSESDAVEIVWERYGVKAKAKSLDSYIDQNFLMETDEGKRLVLKIYNRLELFDAVQFQNEMAALLTSRLAPVQFPKPILNVSKEVVTIVEAADGSKRIAVFYPFVEGSFWADEEVKDDALFECIGAFYGRVDKVLEGYNHPGANRDLDWDLKNAGRALRWVHHIPDAKRRALVEYFLMTFEAEVLPRLPELPSSVIHGDGNDYNVLVSRAEDGKPKVTGLIDFGDSVVSATVFEVAVAATYAAFETEDPVSAMAAVVRGYAQHKALTESEVEVVFYGVAARLAYSVCSSARRAAEDPENTYCSVSEKPAWQLLERLGKTNPRAAEKAFRKAASLPTRASTGHGIDDILKQRESRLGPSLSVSYEAPLKIVRGHREFLFDEEGGTYLDMVNNVSHVGHCHPTVVKAANRQMTRLNTNTRYLHDRIVDYAKRLAGTMPDPLEVCFFVNSGSEANELALRMARTFTGRRSAVVVDGAYHGNTSSIVDLSPYKFDGEGGEGARDHVHKVEMPDPYRGPYKGYGSEVGKKYADHVRQALADAAADGAPAAMFICESLLGCGGQIVLPKGYLEAAHAHVREAGAVLVADEVQVGFGRVGTHFWGFETQGVVPDIVTVGKPIGNGHPLAAVITTKEIAQAFNNGMEYFNTFGGNPVSCSIGMAVLDVIEQEGLQKNALDVGTRLKARLAKLMKKYPIIGDVRGQGLFIGAELVRDRETLEPAAEEASLIIEEVKGEGILLSTDGPLHNVLKVKPPIVFTQEDADRFVSVLDGVMGRLF